MYASLDWLPSLVGGVLSGCGFCLVWYRLRRLERLYQRRDLGVPDAPRCSVCGRWLFAETLAALDRLDDDDKREHCAGCGNYNGPKSNDPPPPPVSVAIAEPSPSPVPVETEPPRDCDCAHCLPWRIATDEAQAQTLGMLEDLAFLRQGLKTLRLTVIDEIDGMNRRISGHLGAET